MNYRSENKHKYLINFFDWWKGYTRLSLLKTKYFYLNLKLLDTKIYIPNERVPSVGLDATW